MSFKEVSVGRGLRLSVPARLSKVQTQGIDSTVALWEGEGLSVLIDEGLFSDSLTHYAERPNYRTADEYIDGHPVRIVSFTEGDGKRFVGAHFPSLQTASNSPTKLTVVVHANSGVDETEPLKIIRSIKLS